MADCWVETYIDFCTVCGDLDFDFTFMLQCSHACDHLVQIIQLGADPANTLLLELTPTPRWPDLMVAYFPPARILFSSKFFSAHVAPKEVRMWI